MFSTEVSPSLYEKVVKSAEWATRRSTVGPKEHNGRSCPGAEVPNDGSAAAFVVQSAPADLDCGPVASSATKFYEGGARAVAVPEPEVDEVDALSSNLDNIYACSRVPSPRQPLRPSNPLF